MIDEKTIDQLGEWCTDVTKPKEAPTDPGSGLAALETVPAEWWNFYVNQLTLLQNKVKNLAAELDNLLATTPDPESTNQLATKYTTDYNTLNSKIDNVDTTQSADLTSAVDDLTQQINGTLTTAKSYTDSVTNNLNARKVIATAGVPANAGIPFFVKNGTESGVGDYGKLYYDTTPDFKWINNSGNSAKPILSGTVFKGVHSTTQVSATLSSTKTIYMFEEDFSILNCNGLSSCTIAINNRSGQTGVMNYQAIVYNSTGKATTTLYLPTGNWVNGNGIYGNNSTKQSVSVSAGSQYMLNITCIATSSTTVVVYGSVIPF